jgi:hypothetical protein
MSIYRTQPASRILDYGHPILRHQTAWYTTPLVGTRCPNLCPSFDGLIATAAQPRGNATVNSGVTNVNAVAGPCYSFDGTSNAHIDMGDGCFQGSSPSPFSITWLECMGTGGPSFANVFGLKSLTGGAQATFQVGRTDLANFNGLVLGPRNNNAPFRFASFPTAASSVGVWRQVIVRSPKSMFLVDTSMVAYTDGKAYTATVAGAAFGTNTISQNYWGWQGIVGAGNTWLGKLANFRFWNRLITEEEVEDLFRDPWVGMRPNRRVLLPTSSSGGGGGAASPRWFLAA